MNQTIISVHALIVITTLVDSCWDVFGAYRFTDSGNKNTETIFPKLLSSLTHDQ